MCQYVYINSEDSHLYVTHVPQEKGMRGLFKWELTTNLWSFLRVKQHIPDKGHDSILTSVVECANGDS